MARSGLRMMPTFPSPSLKFRTAGFPQYGFKAGVSDRACPFGALRVARFASVLRAPRCIREIPVLCRGRMRVEAPPFEQPLYPRGPRSEAGFAVTLHLHFFGPSVPTRRRIPISPLRGLYQMPSLCTLRLGDPRVVPGFRCPSFLTCRPLRPRGDRNRFVPDLRSQPRPSPCYERLGSPKYPAIRFKQGRHSWFAFATACQVACLQCGSDQVSLATETFTSRLSTSQSPFSPLDITTAVSGQFWR